jgi:uncharacterized phosphosugar-binding protein
MPGQQYLDVVRRYVDGVGARELPHLRELAQDAARRISESALIHVYDHGHMLTHELFDRAGGLALLSKVAVARPGVSPSAGRPALGSPPDKKQPVEPLDMETTLARFVVRQSDMRPNDMLFIGSAAGRAPFLVELALEARRAGLRTVGVVALRYAETLPAAHPSGQLLHQVVDDVIDMQTGPGDAELVLDGVEEKVGPASGILTALIFWTFVVELTEALTARGIVPTVYRSTQYPDGPQRYQEARERYRTLGY